MVKFPPGLSRNLQKKLIKFLTLQSLSNLYQPNLRYLHRGWPQNHLPQVKVTYKKRSSDINSRPSFTKPPVSKLPPPRPVKNGAVPRAQQQRDRESSVAVKSKPPANTSIKKAPPAQQPKPKQFPPPDVRKQFPHPDVRRGDPPPKQKMLMKRRIIDDDEYDSEMDDFIDDGPEDMQDYSTYIKDIFGYDRNKYRDIDDDVDNMESTFAQQMREDVRSTKLGIMEDLEDIRREREEKKRKEMRKKGKL
uniref:Uncharacterized protein n=1 Tax=Photinus pyralis TaxID=7054 RepID=A0A1Y1K459_PHOPY